MPQAVEAYYHDGIVELKQRPAGIRRSKALVVFLDAEESEEIYQVDMKEIKNQKSLVDKWIGVIEGAELGEWRKERRHTIEGKPHESAG